MRQFYFLLLSLLFLTPLLGQDFEFFQEGPIHEAFLVPENQSLVLKPIQRQPPAEIKEVIPRHTDTRDHWINGYWAWSAERDEFVWVSGTWRRPPHGHQWIPGFWRQFPEGWVRIQGFWSKVPEREIQYISVPPPDLIDEKIPISPGDNYFWVPGYWSYDASSQSYTWFAGRWERFNKDIVYVPAHYIVRDKGFVFVPAFWDEPLETRGMAFPSLSSVAPGQIEYTPQEALDPLFILELYYRFWPNHLCLYHHHHYYHYELWVRWGGIPPWWAWDEWWCFDWQSQWWLWWWWTHPYYPHPVWLTPELAEGIDPPPDFIIKMMSTVIPPPNVTAKGVVGNFSLLRALRQATGQNRPILPADPNQVKSIQNAAGDSAPRRPFLLPKGKSAIIEPEPDKPFFGPLHDRLQKQPKKATVPDYPPEIKPKRVEKRPKPRRIPSRPSQPKALPSPQPAPQPTPGQPQAIPMQPQAVPSPAYPQGAYPQQQPQALPHSQVIPTQPYAPTVPPPTGIYPRQPVMPAPVQPLVPQGGATTLPPPPMPAPPARGLSPRQPMAPVHPPSGVPPPRPIQRPLPLTGAVPRPQHPQAFTPPDFLHMPPTFETPHPRFDARHPYQEPPWKVEFEPFRPQNFDYVQPTPLPPLPGRMQPAVHGSIPQPFSPTTPQALQHRNYLMTHPQPKRNPPAPRVHPIPGDEFHY